MNVITINGHNVAPYIVDGTYQMDAEDQFLSWQDGNMTEHRIIVASKVSGSFDIACHDDGLSLSDFMGYVTGGEVNGIILCGVYVTNKGINKAINAYYTITNKTHDLTAEGDYVDVLTVELKER